MTEIPEDVMKAAIAAYDRPIVEDGSSLVSLVNRMVEDEVKLCIARAILAERERCLEIAVSAHDEWAKDAELWKKDCMPNASNNSTCMATAASLIAGRINNA